MTEPVVWPGKGESPVGLTPFGFFDSDIKFIDDAPKVADWSARRLGYPTLDIELIDKQFYACFEEAIMEYAHQVNQFNIRENLIILRGGSTEDNLSGKNIVSDVLPFIALTSQNYGTEVGVGGRHSYKTGSIVTTADQQEYDLQALVGDVSESGNRLEVRRIFHGVLPEINRIFGAHGGLGPGGAGFQVPGVSGGGINSFLQEFGFDRLSPAVNFILLPAFEDVLRIQAISFNDTIRRSAFTFEIVNNRVRIFPIPRDSFKLYFHYTVMEERFNSSSLFQDGVIGDYANVPYDNIEYNTINDVGRRWIFEYNLACVKHTLGMVRGKYQSIPIPNSEVTLNWQTLIEEARTEKDRLLKQLRETLEESGLQAQLEKQKKNEMNKREILRNVPLFIYVG